MKIEIIEPSSYCFGVKRAIDLVNKICEENKGKDIYLFGELIHNKTAMKPLIDKGVKVVNFTKNTAESILNSFKRDDIVVFSAHGHDKKYEEILIKNGVTFFDATCPIVQLNLKRIIDSKLDVIFVGKEGHPETMASLAAKENVYLYDIKKPFDYTKVKSEEVLVTNQTTLSFLEVENIFENSDFIYMLNQAAGDRQILAKQLNISTHQLSYVTQSGEGEGLLFYGNVILPFVDHFPTDLELYRIMTTKLSEVSEQKEE